MRPLQESSPTLMEKVKGDLGDHRNFHIHASYVQALSNMYD
jgi:hypothetical protein